MMTQRQTRVTVTPDMARSWLATSQGNRTIKHATKLLEYKKDMLRGAWLYNGDSIRFSEDGVLLDGHHRLTACSEAEVPFVSDVVVVPAEAVHTIDRGANRSEADSLVMEYGVDKAKANSMVSAVKAIINHDEGSPSWPAAGGSNGHRTTHHVVHNWMQKNKAEFDISVDFAFEFQVAHRLVSQGHIAALHYLGSRAYGYDFTEEFLTKVLRGYGVKPDTTEDHIRTAILSARSGQRKMTLVQKVLSIAKGMRSTSKGRNIVYRQNAVFRPNVDNPIFLK
jgi:hypothetical protein